MSTDSGRLVHEPVMTAELVAMLEPNVGGQFLDCTVGTGGHARALLEAGAERLIGIDRDREVLPLAAATLTPWAEHVELIHSDFRQIDLLLDERQLMTVDGALADLGMSSVQLESEGRGFSFRRDDPLDMRMDRRQPRTAADAINRLSGDELRSLIRDYGEEVETTV